MSPDYFYGVGAVVFPTDCQITDDCYLNFASFRNVFAIGSMVENEGLGGVCLPALFRRVCVSLDLVNQPGPLFEMIAVIVLISPAFRVLVRIYYCGAVSARAAPGYMILVSSRTFLL